MGLIGIIIGIAFIYFLGKAILETIWGSICLIWGLFLHAVAFILDVIGFLIRTQRKLNHVANWSKIWYDFGIPSRNLARFKRHVRILLARITLTLGYAVILICTATIITAGVMLSMGQNPMKLISQMPLPNMDWSAALELMAKLEKKIEP